jgi:2-dehydro-3-deoxyphosphooctonate aldolase (KDO 8-P synthase)
MLAGMSQGIGGLVLESHPNPAQAKCDGPCALPLNKLEAFLKQAKSMDDLVKGFQPIEIE